MGGGALECAWCSDDVVSFSVFGPLFLLFAFRPSTFHHLSKSFLGPPVYLVTFALSAGSCLSRLGIVVFFPHLCSGSAQLTIRP